MTRKPSELKDSVIPWWRDAVDISGGSVVKQTWQDKEDFTTKHPSPQEVKEK